MTATEKQRIIARNLKEAAYLSRLLAVAATIGRKVYKSVLPERESGMAAARRGR